MRLFIAIPLPDDLKHELEKVQSSLKGIKWQPAEQMHLTLRFCGKTAEPRLTKLKNGLAMINVRSFSVSLQGVGAFPDAKKPKVIWVGVEKAEPLMNLQRKVEQACQNSGFEPDERLFVPHITLGRRKSKTADYSSFFSGDKSIIADKSFRVPHFNIYRSNLSAEGARHTILKKYPLPG